MDKLQHVNDLTGLPTRLELIHTLNKLLPVAKTNDERLALLFMDLDNFRNINEALGPSIGDFLLQQVAKRITTEMKDNSYIISHFGGDEFAILVGLKESGSKIITEIAKNLITLINQPFKFLDNEILIGTSIGICVFPDNADNTEDLLRYADVARYSAKKLGKCTYDFYTADMSAQALERTLISNDLHKALERNELSLHYQPKVLANTGLVMGAEALIRWKHPVRGYVPPDIFIPIAENTGVIVAIGDWILRTACIDTKKLQEQGFMDLSIAVNLSAYQFRQGDIANRIAEVLWDTKLPPDKLELELTESLVMCNAEKSLLMLRVLKTMGIKIAIDDFGTGYSSLSHLKQFPVDTLKVDQSFVKNMHLDAENATIVSTIIAMAKQLEIKVVAEGVEHKEEADLLLAKGCDYFQGYFYSKPIPIDQFTDFVKNNIKAAGNS